MTRKGVRPSIDHVMTADFLLTEVQLRHPQSFKWSLHPPDVIPMFIADMDFDLAPSIRAALHDRINHTVGYGPAISEAVGGLLRSKLEQQGITDLPKVGWINFLPGVVPGLYVAVLGLTEPGEDVITMTPIYPPFFGAIGDHGRHVRTAALAQTPAGWQIDWAAMDAAVTPKTRVLTLCHPHNPTGRVWNREELQQLADFAMRHNLSVVSDELHADLTLDGPFIAFAAVASPELRAKTITLTGPCKTYNTAGLGIGAMISHNAELLSRCRKAGMGVLAHPNTASVAMWHAALTDDGQWLASVLGYLRGNRDFLTAAVAERLEDVRYTPPQATYLAWLDYRAHPQAGDIYKHLLKTAKVALGDGVMFGPEYKGFVRLNFATSREILAAAIDRMAASR
jgi:cystathionine beta-lyase